ncbi:MAG: HAMP domain-containing histidine kinase [Coriobacteriia bacterium]|nr:HAMP domain-containing histidine kinase [Coriobacteriia bacterium]
MRLEGRMVGHYLGRVIQLTVLLGFLFVFGGIAAVIALNALAAGGSGTGFLAGGLLMLGAAATFGSVWMFGRSLARPVTHMMTWLNALATGDYAEPLGPDGRPASRMYDGKARKKSFAIYREVFDSLDVLTFELRRTEDERRRLEAGREEWISGVTHDLRTPLTSIQGYASVLASDYEFEPDEVRRQAAIVAGQAGHMAEMINDLNLTFRLRADALPLRRQQTDLIELVRDVAVDLANDPRSTGREIAFEEPPGTGRIDADVDPAWFRRALANLLANAVVHNAEGTAVRVSVRREGAGAVVCIADDGAGMDAATLGRLFDRYYRGTATQSAVEGTGLGMAIARQIVEAHGGSVAVSSAIGQGTQVCVRLPLS